MVFILFRHHFLNLLFLFIHILCILRVFVFLLGLEQAEELFHAYLNIYYLLELQSHGACTQLRIFGTLLSFYVCE